MNEPQANSYRKQPARDFEAIMESRNDPDLKEKKRIEENREELLDKSDIGI